MAVVALFVWYLLEHTPFGRHLQAIGVNPSAARLVGLDVERTVVRSFVLSGALVGLAGVLLVARQGGGNPLMGNYFLMPALSAVFLGATAIHPGRFNVPGYAAGRVLPGDERERPGARRRRQLGRLDLQRRGACDRGRTVDDPGQKAPLLAEATGGGASRLP